MTDLDTIIHRNLRSSAEYWLEHDPNKLISLAKPERDYLGTDAVVISAQALLARLATQPTLLREE